MAEPSAILTVTLNAAMDVVYAVDGYRVGAQHRSTAEAMVPGGKGNNVAKTIAALGGRVAATGIVAGSIGDFIERGLAARGVEPAFTRAAGESRVCFSVLDTATGQLTEIYPPRGARILPPHLEAFEARLRELLEAAQWLAVSGSLAAGLPEEYLARVVALGARAGARVVVDTGPGDLASALTVPPWGTKCNAAEAAGLTGIDTASTAGAIAAARAMQGRGARLACVTRGPDEAVLALEDGLWVGLPPKIQAVSPVGSGDALLGGLLLALARGEAPAQALRWGLAAGAANALRIGAGELDPARWRDLLPQTRVERR